MNDDPEMNCIVFQVKSLWKSEMHTEAVPTRAEDGLQAAWRAVQAKTSARPSQVRRIYSEWAPSTRDRVFIARTFPKAEVDYSFPRPAADGWDAAMGEARRVMGQSTEREMSAKISAVPRDDESVYPVLRTYRPGDFSSEIMAYRPLGANLALYLAHINRTPQGTTGMLYVLKKDIDGSEQKRDRLFEAAFRNLGKDLHVHASGDGDETIFSLEHPSGLATAALGLPDFAAKAKSWLERDDLFVGFPNPSCLYITAPGGALAQQLQEAVLKSDYQGAVPLTPACYYVGKTGIRLVAARPEADG